MCGKSFLIQLASEPARKDVLLDLLFTKGEGLVDEVVFRGCLGLGSHETIVFSVLCKIKRGVSKNPIMDFQRVGFDLFGSLVERVPWGTVLRGKGIQQGWTFFRKDVLEAQELTVPMCCKMNWWGK